MTFAELQLQAGPIHLISVEFERAGIKVLTRLAEGSGPIPPYFGREITSSSAQVAVVFGKTMTWSLSWSRYMMYVCRDESLAGNPPADCSEGGAFREFKNSWLLANAENLAISVEMYPAKLRHWGLYGLNQTLDVLAFAEPKVVPLGSTSL